MFNSIVKNIRNLSKKNGAECRLNFPSPPSQRTFITEMHDDSNDDDAEIAAENTELRKSRAKEISLNVWDKVQDNTLEFETTEELLHNVQLSQEMYENALNKLSKKPTVVLKRQPSELWTNQYNPCLLKC